MVNLQGLRATATCLRELNFAIDRAAGQRGRRRFLNGVGAVPYPANRIVTRLAVPACGQPPMLFLVKGFKQRMVVAIIPSCRTARAIKPDGVMELLAILGDTQRPEPLPHRVGTRRTVLVSLHHFRDFCDPDRWRCGGKFRRRRQAVHISGRRVPIFDFC